MMSATGNITVRAIRCRRGTAISEFLLVLPMLAFIVGLTFFFGWALMHKHQVVVSDRYAAWKRIQVGSWPDDDDFNEVSFAGRATTVDLGSVGVFTDTLDELVSAAADQGVKPETLADGLLRGANRFPRGKRARVAASFHHAMPLWTKASGSIRHRHGREGVSWVEAHTHWHYWRTLREQFYPDMDSGLSQIPDPARGMAQTIRRLYNVRWKKKEAP